MHTPAIVNNAISYVRIGARILLHVVLPYGHDAMFVMTDQKMAY